MKFNCRKKTRGSIHARREAHIRAWFAGVRKFTWWPVPLDDGRCAWLECVTATMHGKYEDEVHISVYKDIGYTGANTWWTYSEIVK